MAARKSSRDRGGFSIFSDAQLAATRTTWTSDCATISVFPPDVTQVLDWTAQHQTVVAGRNEIAYGLFRAGSPVAQAICEVVVTKEGRRRWVKLLRMRLRPALEERVYEHDVQAVREVVDLYAQSIEGVFRLKDHHEAETLKLYGRSAELLVFLEGLGVVLNGRIQGHNVAMEGRWLVIKRA